jgi:hypothetical protein
MSQRLSLLAVAAVALAAPSVTAGDVWRVPSQVANIQIAVNVAAPGDVIRVANGTYNQVVVVDGKGVTLVADGIATIATVEVRNVPAGQTFVMDGFLLSLPAVVQGAQTPFLAQDNDGALRIQDCTFQGEDGFAGHLPSTTSAYPGSAGARVETSVDVILDGCRFFGGDGATLYDEDFDWIGTSGGSGLEVLDSQVVVTQSELYGGVGGSQDDTVSYGGGNGGSGVASSGSSFVALMGSTIETGWGGSADCNFFSCGAGGSGGDAVGQGSQGTAWVRGNSYDLGLGGSDGDGLGSGPDGVPVDGGTPLVFPALHQGFDMASPVFEGSATTFEFGEAAPSEPVLLFGSLDPGFLPKAAHHGVFGLGPALLLPGTFVGTIDIGGYLSVPISVPDVPGVGALDLHLQPVYLTLPSGPLLGPSRVLTIIDPAA